MDLVGSSSTSSTSSKQDYPLLVPTPVQPNEQKPNEQKPTLRSPKGSAVMKRIEGFCVATIQNGAPSKKSSLQGLSGTIQEDKDFPLASPSSPLGTPPPFFRDSTPNSPIGGLFCSSGSTTPTPSASKNLSHLVTATGRNRSASTVDPLLEKESKRRDHERLLAQARNNLRWQVEGRSYSIDRNSDGTTTPEGALPSADPNQGFLPGTAPGSGWHWRRGPDS